MFTDEDISDTPDVKEYKKLTRVMKVMVRFYVRGEAAKKAQYDDVQAEIAKIDDNLKMATAQGAALTAFPGFHPKRKAYEKQIADEVAELTRIRTTYEKQAEEFLSLFHWGTKIVATMNWLEGNLKHFANAQLNTKFADLEPIRLTPQDFLKYKAYVILFLFSFLIFLVVLKK